MDAWERRGDLLYMVTEFITVQLNTVNLGQAAELVGDITLCLYCTAGLDQIQVFYLLD